MGKEKKKNENDKHIPFVINMLIMKTYLSPKLRKGGLKTYILCLKAHLDIQTNLLLYSNYMMIKISMKKS